jgi:DNA helicase-2/ATP-dependent DNA helicase PcrA
VNEWPLSDEQRDVVRHAAGHLSVRACPGAGKTRTMVARYLERADALQPSSAAAVLSFTNAAVDEVKVRCHALKRLDLLRFPHFVGTFDAFINRYFVLPFDIREVKRPYRIVESWQSRGIVVKRRGVSCEGISLDALRIDDKFDGHLEERRVPRRIRAQVLEDRAEWETAARAMRKQLHRIGFMSCEDARALAARRIQHRHNSHLAGRMAARFAEVIVDEAQDCDDHQLAVLDWLRSAGTFVVTVCDPDQAIYEFRDAKPTSLERFNSAAESISLTGNFRSAPPICMLSATLRGTGLVDQAVGPEAACEIPVHVRRYDSKRPQDLAIWFKDHLRGLSILEEKAAVLSHRASDALRVVGRHADDRLSNVPAGLLLQAARVFQGRTTDASTRRAAVTQTEGVLLRCLGVPKWRGSLDEAAAEVRDLVELRTLACELLASVPAVETDWAKWCADVRARIESIPVPHPLRWRSAAIGTPRSEFPALVDSATSSIAASTVHGVKGHEFDGVLLVLPDRGADTESLLGAWKTKAESEPKRVVYVGVTRARKSISLGIAAKHSHALTEILHLNGVPFIVS